MRLAILPILLLTACPHAPPSPAADVVACLAPRVGLALAADLVGPLLAHEHNGTITVDPRGCGPGVIDEAEAARLSSAIGAAVPGVVALVKLADDPCVDAWADTIGTSAASLAASLPGALAQSQPARLDWTEPVGCAR